MPRDDPEAQQARSQATLIAFLTTDLDLAFTMLRTASITHDEQHRESTLQHVWKALENIRRLEGRIKDCSAWQAIHDRADELEAALRAHVDRLR